MASAFKRVLAIAPKNGKSAVQMNSARKINSGAFSSEEPKMNSPTKASTPSRIPAPIHNLACSRRVSDTLLCVVSIHSFVLLSVILI